MKKFVMAALLASNCSVAFADPSDEVIFQLKSSVVKVHTVTKSGGQSVGTGVVVSPEHVATNCHVLANASGITVRKFGDNYAPVALKADWKHDICLLRFQGLDLPAVALGDSDHLRYEQRIFSIGFPGGIPKPQVTAGNIKALYAHDDSHIIRTSAAFRMGASGSPLLDEDGKLIGINTFKSPGRNAYFYNVPVKWVKALLNAPETTTVQQEDLPFWDAPEELRPFFMQVVLPLQEERWDALERVATLWAEREPSSTEAWYYLALAEDRSGRGQQAMVHYRKSLELNPQHPAALYNMGVLASRLGDKSDYDQVLVALSGIDQAMAVELEQAVHPAAAQ